MALRKLPGVPDDLDAAVEANPVAVAALDLLLDATGGLDVARALVVESATYSALQAGAEHRSWLGAHRRKRREPDAEPVRMARDDGTLRLTLDRPRVRNAFDAAMRDALLEGLALARDDDSITAVVIDGAGPNFCSGGDLDEFGTTPDPATAHLIRVARSVGRAIDELRSEVTVVVHGTCVGAGVELAAFAGRVVARPDATFRLPEIGMGLVPGAGGTVSLPRRVGAERTRWLAVSGSAIDARTALDWGLIDTISETEGASSG
jgi:enoyl-CoA hydratase/carnithine racemase